MPDTLYPGLRVCVCVCGEASQGCVECFGRGSNQHSGSSTQRISDVIPSVWANTTRVCSGAHSTDLDSIGGSGRGQYAYAFQSIWNRRTACQIWRERILLYVWANRFQLEQPA